MTLATTEKKDRESFECAMEEGERAKISRGRKGTDIRSKRKVKQESLIKTLLLLLAVLVVDLVLHQAHQKRPDLPNRTKKKRSLKGWIEQKTLKLAKKSWIKDEKKIGGDGCN